MKTINNSKDITTLEVGDVIVFGNLEYKVAMIHGYYLSLQTRNQSEVNDKIFKVLNISNRDFVKNLGINILPTGGLFPEVKSLEALTAVVVALFKEYEKQNALPKTQEEFCKRNPIKRGECLINAFGKIRGTISVGSDRDADEDRNYFTSKQEAEAFLALMQLRQLRKAYIKNWESDYKSEHFGIYPTNGDLSIMRYAFTNRSLSFPTYELANQFFNNFKDLLEIAKPLL